MNGHDTDFGLTPIPAVIPCGVVSHLTRHGPIRSGAPTRHDRPDLTIDEIGPGRLLIFVIDEEMEMAYAIEDHRVSSGSTGGPNRPASWTAGSSRRRISQPSEFVKGSD